MVDKSALLDKLKAELEDASMDRFWNSERDERIDSQKNSHGASKVLDRMILMEELGTES